MCKVPVCEEIVGQIHKILSAERNISIKPHANTHKYEYSVSVTEISVQQQNTIVVHKVPRLSLYKNT
jgi:hypothetical protein